MCFELVTPHRSSQIKITQPNLDMGTDAAGNTKGESIAVLLTSCLTGLESAV